MTREEILAMEPGRELDDKWTRRTCLHCSTEFLARTCYVKRGQYKFCSHTCSANHNKKHPTQSFNGTTYYYKQGYYESLEGRKMHRDVWSYHNGVIPNGCVVHHKDEDKTNNDIANLELMEWGKHTAFHHSTGITMSQITCLGCGKIVHRKQSDVNRGQNRYCTRGCSNQKRGRNQDGTYSGNRVI